MKKLLRLFTTLPLVAILMFSPLVFANTGDIVVEGKPVTGKIEVGGGTLELPNSDTLPGTCAVGDTYVLTDALSGSQYYVCESTNVWTPQGSFFGAAYFPDYSETDQGVIGNGKSAKAYIDTISTNSATLVFRHSSGGITTTYTFGTSETIPSNINVIVEKGAILSIAAAQTLTNIGPFDPGFYQVFSGSGNVLFSSPPSTGRVNLLWFGDDANALEKSIKSANGSIPVYIPSGNWNMTGFDYTPTVNFSLIGEGKEESKLYGSGIERIRIGNSIGFKSKDIWYDEWDIPFFRTATVNSIDHIIVNGNKFSNCTSAIYAGVYGGIGETIITYNNFSNIKHVAIFCGTNVTDTAYQSNMDKYQINNNIFYNIGSVDLEQTHAIQVYGQEIEILGNLIDTVSGGDDAKTNAIYTKVKYCNISDNVIIDGAGGAEMEGSAIRCKGIAEGVGGGIEGYIINVTNNIIISSYDSYAINVNSSDSHISGNIIDRGVVYSNGNNYSEVVNNIIRVGNLEIGISCTGNNILIVSDNTFKFDYQLSSVNIKIIKLTIYDNARLIKISDNNLVINASVDIGTPASKNVFSLYFTADIARTLDSVLISNNNFSILNREDLNSGYSLKGDENITVKDGIISNNIITVCTSTFNTDSRIFWLNNGFWGTSVLYSAPGCDAATTAGKVKTVNAFRFSGGMGSIYEVAATDNLWNLTGVTTGAGEYKKVLLVKAYYNNSAVSIIEGDVATAQVNAKIPKLAGGEIACGIVELAPNYTGGVINSNQIYDVPVGSWPY